jgi:hypothetical protein
MRGRRSDGRATVEAVSFLDGGDRGRTVQDVTDASSSLVVELTGKNAALRGAAADACGVPFDALVDLPILNWVLQTTHELATLWILSETAFIQVTLAVTGSRTINVVPMWRVRRVLEQQDADGVIVSVEIDAGSALVVDDGAARQVVPADFRLRAASAQDPLAGFVQALRRLLAFS